MMLPPFRKARRPLAALSALAVLFLALLLAGSAYAAEVTLLEPPAQVKRKGRQVWVLLKLGDEVNEGDSVRTGTGGRVELSITPKRQFRIGQVTEIEIPRLRGKERGFKAKVNLLLGRFWGSLRAPLQAALGENVAISTPLATIGVKGTTFGVDYDKKKKFSQVTVITGQIAVNPPPVEIGAPQEVAGPREIPSPKQISRADWTRLVSADQKLVIRPGEIPQTEPLTDEDKRDPWIAFNIARDRELGN